jgi:hypothetical protein
VIQSLRYDGFLSATEGYIFCSDNKILMVASTSGGKFSSVLSPADEVEEIVVESSSSSSGVGAMSGGCGMNAMYFFVL